MNLKIGNIAPDFTGTAENGQKVSLGDFRGKKVFLFFYPKDMTLNCTIEAGNLRDDYFILQQKGIRIIGVSADKEQEDEPYKTKHDLPHPLIAETNKKIINTYGLRGVKQFVGIPFRGIQQTVFLIDEQGIVEAVIDKVKIGGTYLTSFSIN